MAIKAQGFLKCILSLLNLNAKWAFRSHLYPGCSARTPKSFTLLSNINSIKVIRSGSLISLLLQAISFPSMSFAESNKLIEACFPKKHLAFVWKHQKTENHLSLFIPCLWCKTLTSHLSLPWFCFQPLVPPVPSSVHQGVLGDLLLFPLWKHLSLAVSCLSFLLSYPCWSFNSLHQALWGFCPSSKLPCRFSVPCLIFKSIFWNVGISTVAIS